MTLSGNGAENKGPSVAEMQRLIKNRSRLEVMLITGKSVTGTLKWVDEHALCVQQDDDSLMTLFRTGVIGYKVALPANANNQVEQKDRRDQRDTGSQKQYGKKHGR